MKLTEIIVELGKKLGFYVATEVQASEAAWVDVVWFDDRFKLSSLGVKKPKTRWHPVLPMVGFEIESHTGINAKHVKGSVSNLCNLGALMGVIVLERENLEGLRKRSSIHREQSEKELWKHLLDKVEQWVYAEAQPKMRLVIMKEADIINWAKNEGINIQGN